GQVVGLAGAAHLPKRPLAAGDDDILVERADLLAAGDAAGALASWREMAALSEGPVGTIRAIPELTDTLPAFAYAALGRDAAARADWPEAEKRFSQAQAIVEDYADTPPAYQLSEIATSGGNTAARRQEVRALYEDVVIPGRQGALRKMGRAREADDLAGRRIATVEKLDAFIALPGG
ncbi:MAG TPA: hypothetical protein VM490_16020, partial [Armatimonadaceae bacterium]|nr:hypothetical protein [Armatimonadaceae bacterium]